MIPFDPRPLVRRSAAIVLVAVLAAGCSSEAASAPSIGAAPASAAPSAAATSTGSGTPVTAKESEGKIVLATASAPAGSVTFAINNVGTVQHEFVVIKTDLPIDKLPLNSSGTGIDEEAAGLTSVKEVEDIAPGSTPTLTVDLPAGRYVVVCNLPGHYLTGMRAAFTAN